MKNRLSASTGCNTGKMHYACAIHVEYQVNIVALIRLVCVPAVRTRKIRVHEIFNAYARQFVTLAGDGANWMIQVQTI